MVLSIVAEKSVGGTSTNLPNIRGDYLKALLLFLSTNEWQVKTTLDKDYIFVIMLSSQSA